MYLCTSYLSNDDDDDDELAGEIGTDVNEYYRWFIVLGGLTGGWEAGFPIPAAGGDVKWLEKYHAEFEKKAKVSEHFPFVHIA